jgi:hypothetical protein
MIRFELNNDELFFETFRNYQSIFQDSSAVGDDFLMVLNETTGQDFTAFFNQWYYGEGFPIINANWYQWDSDVKLTLVQEGSVPESTPFFIFHLPVTFYFHDGSDSTVRVFLSESKSENYFNFLHRVDSLKIDPDNWVLKKVQNITNDFGDSFLISPNPVNQYLFINNPQNMIFDFSIIDINGRQVYESISLPNQNIYNLSYLRSGIYFVIVNLQDKKSVRKIVKM